jgi:hypothetical protein
VIGARHPIDRRMHFMPFRDARVDASLYLVATFSALATVGSIAAGGLWSKSSATSGLAGC